MKKLEDNGEPPSTVSTNDPDRTHPPLHTVDPNDTPDESGGSIMDWLKGVVKGNNNNNPQSNADEELREALEEFIEDSVGKQPPRQNTVRFQERLLITNIFKLRDLSVADVMIPRVDICAIDVTTSQKDLLMLLSEKQFSRFPIYNESLDDVLGTIHIKDILATLAKGQPINIRELVRDVPIVAPSMPVLALLLMMKQKRRHLALVIDEYGGIDGLVTVNDVIESIVGEVDDEYDLDDDPKIIVAANHADVDGRVDIEDFENRFGKVVTDEEREEIDTVGGLVFTLAGRVPTVGEIIEHSSGMKFEVIDADARRVHRLRVRDIPGA